MRYKRITLSQGIEFHGHLGPYLVLGLLAGEFALKKLKANKYFGIQVAVYGAGKKPKSCFIDGLQLSTGATYGKGNIRKLNSKIIRALFRNLDNHRKVEISLKKKLINRLDSLKGHATCESFARKLYKTDPLKIFNLIT
ncbi:MAG TPA: formylmethanofuran dehydrogenase subunit E family protein [Candidatus Margulisiibacteriota bacterium]|nr:formylmethanofuran dehydrogenase subunit E family protein [Candidatus Margulisiibacteriota bacterium]